MFTNVHVIRISSSRGPALPYRTLLQPTNIRTSRYANVFHLQPDRYHSVLTFFTNDIFMTRVQMAVILNFFYRLVILLDRLTPVILGILLAKLA
jgi:hypothetical protein